MKKLLLIAVLLLSTALLAGVFGGDPAPHQNATSPQKESAITVGSLNSNPSTSIESVSRSVSKTFPLSQLKENPKVAAISAIVASENAKSLDFYGKIIDQYGNPVEGVKVKAGIGLVVSFARSGGEERYTESDASGNFSFVGIHGAGVGFFLQKEGYFYDQKLPSSSRSTDYVPSPNKPVIFTMWKLKGAEPMIHHNLQATITCDGKPNAYNMKVGHRTPSDNDLTVQLTRKPVNITRGNPFDWSATLQVVDGGMIPIKDLYPNEAPADGYQPSITINMPANMTNWSPEFTGSYYFKSHNGQDYGRVVFHIIADFQPPPTLFDADIYVNPSGSRNLEYDPKVKASSP
jgi:hypothetical protein